MRQRGREIESSIRADIERATAFGIRGSPVFIIYDPTSEAAGKLVGAQPSDRFDTAISRVRNA
jgi:predicted DsbA family dithiol-disulfide isomerase